MTLLHNCCLSDDILNWELTQCVLNDTNIDENSPNVD